MTYLWEHLSSDLVEVHKKIGWGNRIGFGERPAVVVIDVCTAFTDPESPLSIDVSATLVNIKKVLDVARQTNPKIPIIFAVMSYDADRKELSPVILKKKGEKHYKLLVNGSSWVEIDPRLARQPDELVLVKKHGSCFFHTNFGEILNIAKIDTLIITGCSTSGCVHLTAADSAAYGYYTNVVEEAVGDRDPVMAAYFLLRMDASYADVVSLDETLKYLSRFR